MVSGLGKGLAVSLLKLKLKVKPRKGEQTQMILKQNVMKTPIPSRADGHIDLRPPAHTILLFEVCLED